ncbi:hypothetical protein HQQ81_21040 [Microbacteriaceae bacterium VKM Ac-2854]|nr:hypothetical protein [Microbacteriaceae bacterium VKM Ac-2854]
MNDPWGRAFKVLKDAASGLAKEVLPALTSATLPDLSVGWFVDAYRIAFAAAILVAIVLLIPMLVSTARGAMAGRDLAQSILLYFPVFLICGMFGPAFGVTLVAFFHSLSDLLAQWGVIGSATASLATLQGMIDNNDGQGVAGGLFMSILLMLGTIAALVLVLIVLVIQLITLYLSGVVMALGIVWMIDPRYRSFAAKIPTMWLALLASHPLLFFLLGVTFNMTAGNVGSFGSSTTLQALVQGLVAILAMVAAAISPLLLMKFAPVLPAAAAGAAAGVSAAGVIGSPNLTSWMGRNSDSGGGASTSTSTSESETQSTSSTSSSAESGSGTGAGATTGTTSMTDAGDDDATATGGGSSGGGGRHAAPATDPIGASATGEVGGAGAEAGLAEAGAAGAGTAAEVGGTEALVAAGAAESASGVGAVIGVPTLLAAGAVKAGQMATQTALSATEKAADMAENNGEA